MSQYTPSTTPRPVVAIMTDFGLGESDVGVMKAVIIGITPETQIIDITHDIPPQNVPYGAWVLSYGYRYYPKGTVFVCVVDPGVGSSRSAIAVHAGDWYFVGPDNGLFSYIYAQQTIHGAVVLSNSAFHLPQVSGARRGIARTGHFSGSASTPTYLCATTRTIWITYRCTGPVC